LGIKETIDAVGLFCPVPIVKTAEKIKNLEAGDVIEILADDDGFPADIRAWCKSTGNELVGLDEKDGAFVARVKKSC
jgi:TusA-related sulfurtransferase